MFLYSQYRLIGIAHQQAMNPLTEKEAEERACLLNGLFNADLNSYDFLTNSDNPVDDAIDRYQDFQKLKDKICDGLYLRKEVIDEWCADVRKVFIMLRLLLDKYWEVLVDYDMSQTILDKET